MTGVWQQGLILVAVAFVLSLVAGLLLARWAGRIGLLDHPSLERKTHAAATPVVGGIAIAFAAFATHAMLHPGPLPLGLILGAAILLTTGALDDKLDLSWPVRFAAQALAALPMILIDGLRIDSLGYLVGTAPLELGVFSTPFTMFAVLATINALNMADGADGLAGMLSFCTLSLITVAAYYSHDQALTLMLLPFLAALCGFLALNMRFPWMKRAKVFLGNSGSEFLGFLIVWAAIRLTQTPAAIAPPVLVLFFFAMPLVDCLALMIRRSASGRSPFSADRDHLHHVLLRTGMSNTVMVLTISTAALAIGAAAAFAVRKHVPQQVLFAVFLIWLAGYYLVTRRAAKANANDRQTNDSGEIA